MANANLNKSPNAGRMSAADANRTIVNAGRKKTQATTTIVQQIGGGGTSSSVTVTAPLQMSGSVVSIPQATGSVSGYLLSADWSTFNGKEPALGNPASNGYILSSTTAGARSWIAPAGGGSGFPTVTLTKPVAASFPTWVNQSSAAIVDGTTGLVYYTSTAATGAGTQGYGSQVYMAFGGGSTTWECRLNATIDYTGNVVAGIALYESGSTKSVFFGYLYVSGSGSTLYKANYTGGTRNSFVQPTIYNYAIPNWFRARIAAGTIYFEYSASGEVNDWILFTSNALTSDFTTTPDNAGFALVNTAPASFVVQSALAY